MELIVGLIFAAFLTCKVIPEAASDLVSTMRASKAGDFGFIDNDRNRREARRDARREARKAAWKAIREARSRKAGGDGTYRPGAGAYLKDVYHGVWEDLLEKRTAKRKARGPYNPYTRRWSNTVDRVVKERVQENRRKAGLLGRLWRKLIDPVGEPQPETAVAAQSRPSPGPLLAPAPMPAAHQLSPDDVSDRDQYWAARRASDAAMAAAAQTTTKEKPMTATATADGIKYNEAVAEHKAALEQLQSQLDEAIQFQEHLKKSLANVEAVDAKRDQVAAALAPLAEGLEASRFGADVVEGSTVATTALTAGTVSQVQENLEAAKEQNEKWIGDLTGSVESVQASLNQLQAQYGELAAGVQETGVSGSALEAD